MVIILKKINAFPKNTSLTKELLKFLDEIKNKNVSGFSKWVNNMGAWQVCIIRFQQVLQNHRKKMLFNVCLHPIKQLQLEL